MDRRRRCSSLLHHAFSTDAFWKKERCKHCCKHQLHASCLLVQSLSTKAFQGEPVYLQNDIHQAPEGLREAVRTFAFFFYERFFTSTSDHIKKKRNHKQCRERWKNHLDPVRTSGVLDSKTKQDIDRLYRLFGRKHALIAKKVRLTPLRVRNYYYAKLRKEARQHRDDERPQFISDDERPQFISPEFFTPPRTPSPLIDLLDRHSACDQPFGP